MDLVSKTILSEEYIENYFTISAESKNIADEAVAMFKRLSVFLGGSKILPIMPLIITLGHQSDVKKDYNTLAANILAGISLGSRHWAYADYIAAEKLITEFFYKRVSDKDDQVLLAWSKTFNDRDPKRFPSLFNKVSEILNMMDMKVETREETQESEISPLAGSSLNTSLSETGPKSLFDHPNIYTFMIFIHHAVVVTKYRCEKLNNLIIDRFYKNKVVFYKFISHGNIKMRHIFNSILNNMIRSSLGLCIDAKILEDNLVYSLEKVNGDNEEERKILKAVLRFYNNYIQSSCFYKPVWDRWLLKGIYKYWIWGFGRYSFYTQILGPRSKFEVKISQDFYLLI